MLDNLKKYKKVKSIKLSKKYHCPDCDSELIEDHGYFFKCLKCLLEFDEHDLIKKIFKNKRFKIIKCHPIAPIGCK